MELRKFQLQKRMNDTGSLLFLEAGRDVPFEIKRIYCICEVKDGARRGFHAHKDLLQALICIHGSCKVMLDDGSERLDITLDSPSEGLFVGCDIWREIYDFSADAVLMVLASKHYDESDYIRDYNEFINYLKEKNR